MALDEDIVGMINSGIFTPDILVFLNLDFLKTFREQIVQKFYREKAGNEEKRFTEYILLETIRALFKLSPVTFYVFLKNFYELRAILNLKYLKTYEQWRDYDRKRKYLKRDIEKILKRNLTKKADEMYIIDTSVLEVDLSRSRKGKKIKNGVYDAEFVHSSTKGGTVGFIVCVLINFSNLSVVKVEIYPNHTSKKDIWKEMVIDTLGTITGKKKIVIADAGFFAYQNYLFSPHYMIIPVIKPRKDLKDKTLKKIEELPASLLWWDQRYAGMFEDLLRQFHEIIEQTVTLIQDYDNVKKIRSEIEILFKVAKRIFGMEEFHVYYTDAALWKAYICLYVSSLFLQYLKSNKINEHRIIELLQQNQGLT
jgi:hypothetical protein